MTTSLESMFVASRYGKKPYFARVPSLFPPIQATLVYTAVDKHSIPCYASPMIPPTIKGPETEQVRVSVQEAARLFGVNPRTVRRAIQQQELRYIIVRNRYKISFASLVSWSQSHITVQHKRDQVGIGQWVQQWKIRNTRYSPRPPGATDEQA